MRKVEVMVLGVVAGLLGTVTQTRAVGTADWTFMVYMDGDNNLDSLGLLDFAEMASVGSDDHVKIVVLFDRTPDDGDTASDWSDTRRGLVNRNDSPNNNWGESIGEANMGDPDTLVSFADWAMSNYPANHYALVLWDHGNGWWPATERLAPLFRGVCYDDTDDGDGLSINELRSALQSITTTSGPIDLVGFDACLMSMVEIAYELRSCASVMVGATSIVVGYGWPYDDVLGPIAANPSMTAAEIGQTIVQAYNESIQSLPLAADPPTTMSAVDLSAIEALTGKITTLASSLRAHYAAATSECSQAARDVMTAIDAAVIYEKHTPASAIGHGLAIYFPNTAAEFLYLSQYNSSVLAFPGATQWDSFLGEYESSMSGTWVAQARTGTQECDSSYVSHVDLYDFCSKISAAVAIEDADEDGVADDDDNCPQTANADQTDTDADGAGNACDDDDDNDGVADDADGCPVDANKTDPGVCGCGIADTDSDGDGTADCSDECPNDPATTTEGHCGCGVGDTDSDGTADCDDLCPTDPAKVTPGYCGCGTPETDSDGDGTPDCIDPVNNNEQVGGWQNDPLGALPTCATGSSLTFALMAGLLFLKPRSRRR